MPLQDKDHNRPLQPEPSRLNNHETLEKANEAHALLENSVLKDALLDIYSRASGTLLDAEPGSLTATGSHAMMKSVIDLQLQLEQYISDDKMRQKYNKGDK
jgi:hypothetical protein